MSNVSHEEVVDYIFTAPSAVSAKIQDTQVVNHKCQHFLKHTNCIPGGGAVRGSVHWQLSSVLTCLQKPVAEAMCLRYPPVRVPPGQNYRETSSP